MDQLRGELQQLLQLHREGLLNDAELATAKEAVMKRSDEQARLASGLSVALPPGSLQGATISIGGTFGVQQQPVAAAPRAAARALLPAAAAAAALALPAWPSAAQLAAQQQMAALEASQQQMQRQMAQQMAATQLALAAAATPARTPASGAVRRAL